MSDLDQYMDHAAELQLEVNRLSREVWALALAGLALALTVTLMGWQLWAR